MAFAYLRALMLQPRGPRKTRDWDAHRFLSLEGGMPHVDPEQQIREEVSEMHWLSQLCFLEGCSPQQLLLTPELLARVTKELKRLQTLSALEVTALIFELCVGSAADSRCAEDYDSQAA